MHIGKPIRHIGAAAASGLTVGIAVTITAPTRWVGIALVAALPAWLVLWLGFSFCLDALDDWLRRVTRDPLCFRHREK